MRSFTTGRLYSLLQGVPADLRWFWSVTVYVDPKAGIRTSGKVATLDDAKAQFEAAWRRWLAWTKLREEQMPPEATTE